MSGAHVVTPFIHSSVHKVATSYSTRSPVRSVRERPSRRSVIDVERPTALVPTCQKELHEIQNRFTGVEPLRLPVICVWMMSHKMSTFDWFGAFHHINMMQSLLNFILKSVCAAFSLQTCDRLIIHHDVVLYVIIWHVITRLDRGNCVFCWSYYRSARAEDMTCLKSLKKWAQFGVEWWLVQRSTSW